MSSAASQVILHPTVSQSLKVLGTTLGRDKLYRAAQYFARFLAWYLISRGHKIEGARWNALKSHLALARKLMRLGKPIEHLQAALRAAQVAAEPGEQITTICRQLGYFGYLTYDTLVWANAIKFFNFKPSTAGKISKNANRFWLTGILFSITHGLLKAGRLANEVKKLQGAHLIEKGQDADRDAKLRTLFNARDSTRHQFIIDLLDVWIPASNLGYTNLNDGVLGIFGLITSLMAFRQQWLAVNSK
ncbi:peroxisomal biogenesis factor 11 [Daedalea quercina L-15889]|uniref:Peroxisomal biogenesis factor 11 n=1 Tax=Daedalea quercina L-15889 TaxID=1314783 RepID=A0A165UDT8_9APHY|nr:peroxisomal biogenesis factor 11 [Daedalea quercina L-15889]